MVSVRAQNVPPREVILGIDFGTSTSSAAAYFDNEVHLVLDGGDPIVPSVVYAPRNGDLTVGTEALRHGSVDPHGLLTGLKRILGRRVDDPAVKHLDAGVAYRLASAPNGAAVVRAGGTDYAPVQLVAAILARLRRLAEIRFGGAIRKAVLTVPVERTSDYVAALTKAASIAGLEVVAFVPEPVAGVVAHGHDKPGDRRIAVCDFGGGTFDVTLMEKRGSHFHGVGSAGDAFLGGDDLDAVLADGIDSLVFRQARVSMRKDVVTWSQLLSRVESAKRQLSTADQARLRLRDAYTHAGARHDLDFMLDRAYAEPRWRPLIERAVNVTASIVASGGWRVEDIGDVVLIGGTALVPMVQRELSQLFKRPLVPSPTANLAVVRGAALLAARHAPVKLTNQA